MAGRRSAYKQTSVEKIKQRRRKKIFSFPYLRGPQADQK
jgi:hypothetical protein